LIPKDEPPIIAPMSLRGRIHKTPDGETYIDRSDLQESNEKMAKSIYIQARIKMSELQPNISLPPPQSDPVVGLQTLLECGGETKQKDKAGRRTRAKRGRPRKYKDEQLGRMSDTYDNLYDSLKDSKAAWEQVAKNFGAKNGDAARVAVASYKKKLKKSR